MPRYIFRTDADRAGIDPATVELPSIHEAQGQAVAYMGELLRDMNGAFWERGHMSLTVEDETGLVLVRLDVAGTLAPAVSRTGSARSRADGGRNPDVK